MYDNQERFVTAAYRKKLEEDKLWQESQRLRCVCHTHALLCHAAALSSNSCCCHNALCAVVLCYSIYVSTPFPDTTPCCPFFAAFSAPSISELDEQRNDVTKVGHMGNFFANLSKNVAMGGVGQAAPSVPSATPSEQQPVAVEQPKRQEQTQLQPEQQAVQQHHGQQQQRQQGQQQQAVDAHSGQAAMGHPAEPSVAGQQRRQGERDVPAAAPTPHLAAGSSRSPPTEADSSPGRAETAVQAQSTAGAGGKRKNDDDSVAAARERYLARKRAQGSGA